jgi:hypothetical protein
VPRSARVAIGLALGVLGVVLVLSPLAVASTLSRPHATSPQMINLRASWGGSLLGLGAFVAWLPSPRPLGRAALGLLLFSMAGIGLARATGFVLDGGPDALQWVWLGAEIVLVIGAALGLRALARRARA